MNPHHRHGSALAHEHAGSEAGPGESRRSVGRSFHTPRDGRFGDRPGRPGTLPPVPGRLTFLYATAAVGLVLFALLTWQVTSHGPLIRPDRRLLRAVLAAAARHGGASTPAHDLCKLGNIQVAVPVLVAAVAAAAWLGLRAGLARWWLPPLAGAVVMAVLPLVVTTVKTAVHRPPPGLTRPDPSGYGYFPSGHTATSSVAYGAALLLVLPWLGRAVLRRVLVAGTSLLIAAVGAALVWCDYHWPLDVLGSWCLAAVLLPWVAAANTVSRRSP
ncbi:phosphatase PAP2 family protein [Streptomyces sp. HPF1205]|uniref:phosphatase PAP2 family protein n=1 Tax=Streptomyces sp. HPF1205 TaxID=2873262 RepID=UPI001CEDBA08|nr:phosphatase PAP2 family protein [Streptomyces sp. HPF1205]